MHRNDLLVKLTGYRPFDTRESESLRRIIEFVGANPRCFLRSLSIGHITGSAWLIDGQGDRVLLTHHRKLGMWLQLGGHADGNADVLQVALREAKEESGLSEIRPVNEDIFDLDVHDIPMRDGEPAHTHFDIRFLLQAEGVGKCRISDESVDLRWFTPEELNDLCVDESLRRMARKWRRWLESSASRRLRTS